MRALSSVEREVCARLDADALVATLAELVAIESVGGAETPAQAHAAAFLDDAGLDVETFTIDLEALAAHPRFSMELARDEAVGVAASYGRDAGPSLLLDAHTDVVPPGDPAAWSVPPWEATLADGRVYGRGTCDTKGGLAAVLHAARAIAEAGVDLSGRLVVAPVVAEEDGGAGTLGALVHGVTADAAVVVEPTGLAVAPAQAGALSFRLTVPGRTAHGALRGEGVSAVEKFWAVHEALRAFEDRRNAAVDDVRFAHLDRPYALCIGRVEAGDWASNEPDLLRAEGRFGVGVDEALDEAKAAFEGVVAEAAAADPWLAAHPPAVEWWGAQWYPGAIAADHELVGTLGGALADAAGHEPRVEGVPYGSDLGHVVGVGGIPGVVFGPGDIRLAHRPDEHVAVDELVAAARTLAVTALRWCGAG